MSGTELEYCLKRARQEAHSALKTNVPEAAAAHQSLSVRYSARALLLRVQDTEERVTARAA